MEIKEIEIDSTYRNRCLYPNPCDFVLMVNTSSKGFDCALDPVSLAAPSNYFRGNTLDSLVNNVVSISGQVVNLEDGYVDVSFPNSLFTENNYYSGLYVGGKVIQKYEFIEQFGFLYYGRFSINRQFNIGDVFTIKLWTTYPLNILNSKIKFFIPSKTFNSFKYLYNESKHNYNEIISSDMYSVTVLIKNIDWNVDDVFSLRNNLPSWIGLITSNTINTITVNVTDSTQNNFIFIPSIKYFGKITNKNGLIFTVYPNITSSIIPGSEIQCLPFSYDNTTSLPYIGTSDLQPKTYLIDLVSLQIPNKNLVDKNSLFQYSHLYIEFRDPLTSPQFNIMSNNPKCNNAYFRVVTSRTQSSKDWIAFDCDGSKKTIRFSPTSTQFCFKILTPTGETLKFKEKDDFWPLQPIENLQVNALFNVKIMLK